MTRVGVAIPVGPLRHHQQYLAEALASVAEQTVAVDSVVLVDDMAAIDPDVAGRRELFGALGKRCYVWAAPWRLGVATAFNVGVAVSFACHAEAVIMLGADDKLAPDCVERLTEVYEASERADERYYWFGVEYSDDRADQYVPCHAAAVTPGLWRWTGGFSPEMALWAPDAAFISVLLAHGGPGILTGVAVDAGPLAHPLYGHRVHAVQETAQTGIWAANGIGDQVRGIITEKWKPAEGWGRYE